MSKNQTNSKISSFIHYRKSMEEDQKIIDAGKIISEIEQVDVDRAAKIVLQRINQKKTIPLLLNYFRNIAAILLIPLLLFSAWSLFKDRSDSKTSVVARQEITSPSGVRTKIDLPDGTMVWLNAGSTLKFPIQFVGKERDVELNGEAFFEVAKNKEKPFIVSANKARVKVLGTSFNFMSYQEDNSIEVVLKEGKVLFESEYGKNKEQQVMEANSRLVADKQTGKIEVSEVHVNKYIAWHENKLVFDESPISELAQKLERWYGVEVVVDDEKLHNYRFTTTFENESLHQVLELLELSSPINIRYVQAKFDSSKNIFTRSQVIISKK